MKTICLLLALLKIQQISSLYEDYYWREYTGTIPEDALVGGQDINGKNIYIGQAYVPNQGLIVLQIFPGVRQVSAPIVGVHNVSSYIKILCGVSRNFYWSKATAADLHLQMIGKRPIIGGHENGGVLYIGRISFEGDIKIGKITSFNTGNARFYFVNKEREQDATSYEILLYNDNAVDVRMKPDSE